jgi:CheY-like chemotaxis protein
MEKQKILVAEDEEVTRHLVHLAFQKAPHCELRLCANGEEALQVYKSWQPDILLMDIMMPVMNGFQTLRVIRETLADRQTTVIMVSSVSEKSDIVACARLGIQGYILKPFDTGRLPAMVLAYHRQGKERP